MDESPIENPAVVEDDPLVPFFPEEPYRVFLASLLAGELDSARAQVLAGLDLDRRSSNGWRLLDFALVNDDLGLFCALLGLGASANWSDAAVEGMTPLILASGKTDLAWAQACLEAGADVNHTTDSGDTPLIYAAAGENLPLVSLLLDAGADLNRSGHHDTTPLLEAVKNGDVDMVRLLLERGANARIPDEYGDTAAALIPEVFGPDAKNLTY